MDLVGQMLLLHLTQCLPQPIIATSICAPFHRRFTRLGYLQPLVKADRFVNRWRNYPRFVSALNGNFDVYHIVDHSYSHLVHHLPGRPTVVTCHDVDAFRCLIAPDEAPRSRLFKKVSQYVLTGFQKASRVVCDSRSTQDDVVSHGLVPLARLVVNPLGVHPACSPDVDPTVDAEGIRLLGHRSADVPEVLHVGSTITRKRLDTLIQLFAEVRQRYPRARLVRVGGPFTQNQMALVDRLGLTESVRVLPLLEGHVLAAVYRRASLVLLPSEREGFGLPVIEAMACGTPVIASDIPALRELGGDAATYCRVGDVQHWTETVLDLLRQRRDEPERWVGRRNACIQQASKFTWREHATRMVEIYQQALNS